MTNTYGYNRKTTEQDAAILAAVQRHHDTVVAKGYTVVMTSLVGSQDYDLDDEHSDVDTFSLVYPDMYDLATAAEPVAFCMELEDGHAEVKDIRIALNLLKKTSPNSVEYFVSKYKVYNPIFEDILKEYLDDNNILWPMVHCNYHHMLYAMAGMAHQLTKRNMPAGKRYAHAIRLDNMRYHFLESANASAVIELRMGGDRDLAMMVKRDTNPEHENDYNNQCEQIASVLDNIRDNYNYSKDIAGVGYADVESLQNCKKAYPETYKYPSLSNVQMIPSIFSF